VYLVVCELEVATMRRPRHRKSSVNSNISIYRALCPSSLKLCTVSRLGFRICISFHKNLPTFFNSLFLEELYFFFCCIPLFMCNHLSFNNPSVHLCVSSYRNIIYICHSFLLYIRNICISYTCLNASEFQNSQYKIILFHFCHSSYNNAHAILSPILLSYSSMKMRISCLPFSLYWTAFEFLHT